LKRETLTFALLNKIKSALWRCRRHPSDGPMLDRFGYDHGNGLIYDSNGKCDLLFEHNSEPPRIDAARLLSHCSPKNVAELERGYRLAKLAGLLDDLPQDQTEEQLINEVSLMLGLAPQGQRMLDFIEWYRAKIMSARKGEAIKG
jgi:hypothetical protein